MAPTPKGSVTLMLPFRRSLFMIVHAVLFVTRPGLHQSLITTSSATRPQKSPEVEGTVGQFLVPWVAQDRPFGFTPWFIFTNAQLGPNSLELL